MPYSLFLDDERFPANTLPDDQWETVSIPCGQGQTVLQEPVSLVPNSPWVVCRTVEAAIVAIGRYGCPHYIMFDHDLQTELTGFSFAKWLVEADMDNGGDFIPKDFTFHVHSQNVNGAANIQNYLGQYLGQR